MHLNTTTPFYTALIVTNFVGKRSAKTAEYKTKESNFYFTVYSQESTAFYRRLHP
jgi:hypothetical protein